MEMINLVHLCKYPCFQFSEVYFVVSVFLFYLKNNVVINMIMTMFYKCKSSTPFELDEALSIIVFHCYISLMYFNNLNHAIRIALVNHVILTNISFCLFIILSFIAAHKFISTIREHINGQ